MANPTISRLPKFQFAELKEMLSSPLQSLSWQAQKALVNSQQIQRAEQEKLNFARQKEKQNFGRLFCLNRSVRIQAASEARDALSFGTTAKLFATQPKFTPPKLAKSNAISTKPTISKCLRLLTLACGNSTEAKEFHRIDPSTIICPSAKDPASLKVQA
jgi:hypothetical protein